MGLLDDAIREHLELKRKHGASDDEVQRQETEALGPARRDFAPAETAAPEAPVAPAVPSDEPVAERAEAPSRADDWLEEPEVAAPFAAGAPAEPLEHAAEAAEPAAAAEPLPAPDPVPAAGAAGRTSDTPTQAFDALSADEEAEEGSAEDVLEETPDFLQDTPEHDRLWFEQKPPRDFDFDD